NPIGWPGVILLIATVTGCALVNHTNGKETQAVDTHPIIAILTPDIERLYLSWHELDQAYKDLKFLESGFLFDPDDRQLAYIQKAGLYVQDAAVRIHHRWEQLSVLHYIHPEMMRDYLTLNVKGLTSAIKEIEYDEKFLTIYGTFITHEAVTDALNRSREWIEVNKGVLNQILERLRPIENTTTPATVL
ncbi:MAG: hypothetical protein KFF68_00195, partial [Desulfosarcina sp.]|nr:hypothetical protein [Desulfosarcina sp.]